MPPINLSEDTYNRILEFKQVVDTVLDEETEINTCIELVVNHGVDTMVSDLIRPLGEATIVKLFQGLASKHPEVVYGFISETMKQGSLSEQKEQMRKSMGFKLDT